MHCQSCGAKNEEHARFCNMCGGGIAAPGEAGGPIPAAAYSSTASSNTTSVSLAAIGVRSSKKTWVVLIAAAIALIALGALASYLLRNNDEPLADAGGAGPDDPFILGTPLPVGDDVPEPDFVEQDDDTSMGSTKASMRTRRATGRSTMRRRTGGSRPTEIIRGVSGNVPPTPTGGSMTTGSQGTTPQASPEPTSPTAPSSATAMSTSMSAGSTTMGGATTGSSEASAPLAPPIGANPPTAEEIADRPLDAREPAPAGAGPDPNRGAHLMEGEAEDVGDVQMDMYASHVRSVVRQFYARRAGVCFDRATRTNPSVHGVVVIQMTINGAGRVPRARPIRNTTGDDHLGRCLAERVKTWELPRPPGGEQLEMQMPFSR